MKGPDSVEQSAVICYRSREERNLYSADMKATTVLFIAVGQVFTVPDAYIPYADED
jgi:hypothetical protein